MQHDARSDTAERLATNIHADDSDFPFARLLATRAGADREGNAPAATRQEQSHGRPVPAGRADPDLRVWACRSTSRTRRSRSSCEDTSPTAPGCRGGFLPVAVLHAVTPLTSMREAEQLMRERKVDAIVLPAIRLLASAGRRQCDDPGPGERRRRQSGACAAGVCAGRASAQWSIKRAAAGEGAALHGTAGVADRSAPLVQRGEQQHLVSRARADRADHDTDRRTADVARDGARVGAGHARGAVRHAGQQRTRSSSPSSFLTSAWALSASRCASWRQVSLRRARFAARCC